MKAEEKAKKKKNENQIMIEVQPPAEGDEMVPFAGLAEEESEDVPDAFDGTLENLMTIEESVGNADASMVTDQAAAAGVEEAGEKAPKEEKESASGNDSRKSLTRVVRILRFL